MRLPRLGRSVRTAGAGALLFAAALSAADTSIVFQSGEGGYHTYRIPAIIATKKGTLLAFCEGRRSSSSDTGDIDLLVKRSRDNGRTWSGPITVADFDTDTIGNPAPVVDRRTGTIWLLLTRNPGDVTEKQILAGTARKNRTVWVSHSTDDGMTWTAPEEITASVKQPGWTWYATGPGNGIQLKDGRLMVACDHNRGDETQRYSHVIFSDDRGKTWKLGGSAGPQCNESTVAERPDGSLVLNMRSYAGKNRRAVSISQDRGATWSEPVLDDALIEPVCQASLLRQGRSSAFLFSNPADAKRRNMTVRLSPDGGNTWTGSKSLWAGPAAYSNLIELPRKSIGVLYERGEKNPYESIVFDRFPLADLTR